MRLADRLLIAKEEDDFLARMIRSDQKSYKELVEAWRAGEYSHDQ